MKPGLLSRREIIESCISRGMLVAGVATLSQANLLALWRQGERQSMTPTRGEILGPFFKKGAPNTRVLRQPGDRGLPLAVTGKVWNTRGEIISSANLDIWHADHDGNYDLKGYKYRAQIRPGADGNYSVETIMPGHYPDRPAQHIHYIVSAPGHKTLVVQAYFATDRFFEGNPDKNSKQGGVVLNRENVRPVTLDERAGAAFAAITFDIVLERL